MRQRIKSADNQGQTSNSDQTCPSGSDSVLESYAVNNESTVTFNVQENQIVHDLCDNQREKCEGYINHLYDVIHEEGGKKKEVVC